MHYWDGCFGWGGGIFMMFFMLLFWVAVIFLAFYLLRKYVQPGGSLAQDGPLDIAKKRYAKGEISREEFERIKNDLQS